MRIIAKNIEIIVPMQRSVSDWKVYADLVALGGPRNYNDNDHLKGGK